MDLKLITSAVRIENLTKKFDDTFAIKEMSLNIAKGKITALTGEDAAGKTTLIRLITGLLKPSCGKIQTLGLDPFIQKSVLNSKIGYMPQKFGLYEVYQDIPMSLNYDGIEVTSIKELKKLREICPYLNDEYVFFNSDAHYLEAISEPENQFDREKFYQLWRK